MPKLNFHSIEIISWFFFVTYWDFPLELNSLHPSLYPEKINKNITISRKNKYYRVDKIKKIISTSVSDSDSDSLSLSESEVVVFFDLSLPVAFGSSSSSSLDESFPLFF